MNNSTINTNLSSYYDHNGAIMYTFITLVFYSLSLFCSLILNIDPHDHYYEKKWAVYQTSKNQRTLHSNEADILNDLSNESLRQKYWRIYYGDDEFEFQSKKFQSAEVKRLSIVLQRMNDLNDKQLKHSSIHEELEELNLLNTNKSQQPTYDPLSSSILFKFRRSRSTSIPGVFHSDSPKAHRSFDLLCQKF